MMKIAKNRNFMMKSEQELPFLIGFGWIRKWGFVIGIGSAIDEEKLRFCETGVLEICVKMKKKEEKKKLWLRRERKSNIRDRHVEHSKCLR